MEEKSPVFVKIDEYKKILDVIDNLKKQIQTVHETIAEIRTLREEEEQGLEEWEDHIADVQRKVSIIDRTLFEPEN